MADNANQDAVKHLNTLISTNKDSQKGFQEAAEEAESSEYKRLFNEYAGQRGRFASELQNEVRSLGGDPAEGGSAAAAAHRVWLDVRNAVTGKGDHDIIAECERGEDVAVERYKNVLDETLPVNVQEIVRRQYADVQAAHDRIRNLKEATA